MRTMLDFSCFKLYNNELYLLLRKRDVESEPAFGEFALIGGQVWEKTENFETFDRDINEAKERILKNKAGFKPSFVSQIDAIGSVNRDSRGWSISIPHYCFITEKIKLIPNLFKWVKVDDVLDNTVQLPFDHNDIVKKCYDELLNRLTYSSIILEMLPREFVIADLVETFASFNLNVSKQTIHARFVKSGIIVDTNKKQQNKKGGKPAALFTINKERISYFERAIG